jgi:hypothetical protein
VKIDYRAWVMEAVFENTVSRVESESRSAGNVQDGIGVGRSLLK